MATTTRNRALTPGRKAMLVVGGLFAFALIAVGTWTAINALGTTTETRSLTLAPTAGRLIVRTDGDIQITAGSGSDVQITERIRHSIGRPRVEETSTPDGVVLDGDCAWYSSICDVNFQVTVPSGLTVDATTSAGDITLSGATGNLRLSSSAGDVTATGLRSGSVEATSSAGDVQVGFDAPPTAVTVHSSAGDVNVTLPQVDGGYRVHVSTSAGDQDVRVPIDPQSTRVIDATTSAGDVGVRLG
ncbi:MAG: hypothetical protein V7637_4648 [Mycobacteriales bacterium]|jgi:hypothetical protein